MTLMLKLLEKQYWFFAEEIECENPFLSHDLRLWVKEIEDSHKQKDADIVWRQALSACDQINMRDKYFGNKSMIDINLAYIYYEEIQWFILHILLKAVKIQEL